MNKQFQVDTGPFAPEMNAARLVSGGRSSPSEASSDGRVRGKLGCRWDRR